MSSKKTKATERHWKRKKGMEWRKNNRKNGRRWRRKAGTEMEKEERDETGGKRMKKEKGGNGGRK